MKFGGIQALRALAAVLVVFQHSVVYVTESRGADLLKYQPVNFGAIGVWMFFVISGYVMTRCLGQGRWFLTWRLARIYPPFWSAVLLSFFASFVITIVPWVFTLGSVTLLPFFPPNNSYLIPYWTLVYEIQFYVVIALLIFMKAKRSVLLISMVTWICVIIVANGFQFVSGDDYSFISKGFLILFSPTNVFFISGFIFGILEKELALEKFRKVSLITFSALAFTIGQFVSGMPSFLKYAVISASIIVLMSLVKEMRVPRIFLILGNASYGLYLTHKIAILLFITLLSAYLVKLPTSATIVVIFSLALVAGTVFGVIEHLFYTRITRPAIRSFTK